MLALTQPFLGGALWSHRAGLLLVAAAASRSGAARPTSRATCAPARRRSSRCCAQRKRGAAASRRHGGVEHGCAQVRALLPGLGEPTPSRSDREPGGRPDARGARICAALTGATVLAIMRGDGACSSPAADEVLRAGDVLALAGTQDAVAYAERLLEGEAEPQPPA